MVELKKQFDAWTPTSKAAAEPQASPYTDFAYAPNPRVEVLEKELAKLRRQLANSPTADKQINNLNYALNATRGLYEDALKHISDQNDIIYSRDCTITKLSNEKDELHVLMNGLMNELGVIKGQVDLLKQAEINQPEEIDLTLWQKIKYCIGDKSVKRYN